MKKRKFPYFTALLAIIAVAIFLLSSYPMPKKQLPIPFLDKIYHFIAFCVFAALAYGSLRENNVRKRIVFWTLSISAIYGAAIEIYQYFVPYRECSFWDWLADLVGATVAIVIISKIMPHKNEVDVQ